MTVLILGGTGEARRLAGELPGIRVISSLAGRVRTPRLPPGEVRIGGFGGPDGLRKWLLGNDIHAVVDATHPFAARMTATAAQVTAELAIPFTVLSRPGWSPGPGDDWRWVDSVAEAARNLPAERVFLATGREELAEFADLGNWFLARSVEPPQPPVPRRLRVVLDRGPFTVEGELALMREHGIQALVTKDSGGEMTAAKLTAARELGIPVVVVRRPPLPAGVSVVSSVDEAVSWVRGIGEA
ncbi:cobalt-precorrin-6A reductase [Kibdelosporangium persicum]|uniref:Precorrin-6A/cobalt-precorrin-6A reductase n=1 Tax=Kibdelosporangium persicum TaxID=2698649 RepID=A0ABX2EVC5_9PSEU|nr:cobalt-precorrin-6A reductase [Kibdelosporangium persicum]NRN62919.1 Precorrin-6A/cobalt-precorrin-6A reductase [Kibdelosporangium persicum]